MAFVAHLKSTKSADFEKCTETDLGKQSDAQMKFRKSGKVVWTSWSEHSCGPVLRSLTNTVCFSPQLQTHTHTLNSEHVLCAGLSPYHLCASVCLSVCLSVNLSVCLLVSASLCFPVFRCISLSMCLAGNERDSRALRLWSHPSKRSLSLSLSHTHTHTHSHTHSHS